ncbi:HlyU family transcriptional regulator [Vibrio sp. PP-XX7]
MFMIIIRRNRCGFLSRIFGKNQQKISVTVEPVCYKEFLIYPEAIAENGQYRIAGRIAGTQRLKTEMKEHLIYSLGCIDESRGDADA